MSKGTKQIRAGRITALISLYERVIQEYARRDPDTLSASENVGDMRVMAVYQGVIEDLKRLAGE